MGRTWSHQSTLREPAPWIVDSVSNAISQAAPAHLVTHHGGGSSGCTDYTSLLQTTPWHDFHVFQSGHCLSLKRNVNPGQELPCDPRRNYFPFNGTPGTEDETAAACVTRRAQEMSFNLFSQTTVKPSVNGEAVYDQNPTSQASAPAPGNRQYVRHTAYMSALSGSFGFTYGTDPVVYWSFTGSNTLTAALGPVPNATGTLPLADHSARDMQRMASIFKARPWKEFVPEPTRIKNQPTASESKMAYAHSTNYVYNLAYLPVANSEGIRLDLSPLSPAFVCGGNSWKAVWIRPGTNDTVPIDSLLCSGASSDANFKKPRTCQHCEWVLSIIRTGAKIDESGDPVLNALQIWPELLETGVAIRGQLHAPSGEKIDEPTTLSQSSEEIFRKQPIIARDGAGGFFVVWEAEDQDGSLFGIFGRRFDNLGRPLGDEFQVNAQTDHDQAEPWVSTAPSGDVVVVWMSFDQDGDLGGIFGQRYDKLGRLEGTEFQVNTVTQGHQGSPRVDMDAQGGFIVTWESEGQEGEGLGIFGRRFNSLGLPAGEEFQVTPSGPGDRVLADLRVQPGGSFESLWYDYTPTGDLLSLSSRRFDAEDQPEE